jgi:hypothetical protein
MSQPVPPTRSRSHDHAGLRRRRWGLLAGLALMFLGAPAMVVVALVSGADWAILAALGVFAVGLVTVGGTIAPGRSSFHGGTKTWQNDGVAGGGGGGAA